MRVDYRWWWAQHRDASDSEIADLIARAVDAETLRGAAVRHFELQLRSLRRAEAAEAERVSEARAALVQSRRGRIALSVDEVTAQILQRKSVREHGDQRTVEILTATRAFIADVAATIGIELTPELLTTQVAIGDGRHVRWGDMTVADHRDRIARLTASLASDARLIARHRVAEAALLRHGHTTLRALYVSGITTLAMAADELPAICAAEVVRHA